MHSLSQKNLRRPAARPTIGLLTASVLYFWKLPWLGVVDAARARGANVICFAGSVINAVNQDYHHNVVFDLAKSPRIDGLIVWSSAIDGIIGGAGMQEFCQRYHPLPIVSVERAIAGIPSLLMDDYAGIQAAMQHFIVHHGYRRIAFISGAKNHAGAQERYRAYAETLQHHGLPYDPDLVSPPTTFWDDGESKAKITEWLDQRQPNFEAIMGVNDAYTLVAMDVLEARGIRVPDDVAVAGFDAQTDGTTLPTALTTVRPPFYDLGQLATETVLNMLAGTPVAPQIVLPTELIVRQSCGCFASPAVQSVMGVADRSTPIAATPVQMAGTQADAQSTLGSIVAMHQLGITADSAQNLLDTVLAEASGQTSHQFLPELNRLLRQSNIERSTIPWYRVCSNTTAAPARCGE